MAYIFSFVILFLASYVSAVYADNSDAGNLGPNNVDQIPSNNGHHHHGRKTTTKRPTTTCTNCAPSLNVTPGSAPINQTRGVDPDTGCSTITFSCSNPGSGPIAFQYFYQDQDLGTTIQNGTSGTTIPNQITRMVVCNKAGQYWFVENSINRFIDTVNCIVA
uniref:C6 domain-containing protein n=1 Tax=Acrobeloides nanus TaxID=290746 RepID=A0A914DI80_9BILA